MSLASNYIISKIESTTKQNTTLALTRHYVYHYCITTYYFRNHHIYSSIDEWILKRVWTFVLWVCLPHSGI